MTMMKQRNMLMSRVRKASGRVLFRRSSYEGSSVSVNCGCHSAANIRAHASKLIEQRQWQALMDLLSSVSNEEEDGGSYSSLKSSLSSSVCESLRDPNMSDQSLLHEACAAAADNSPAAIEVIESLTSSFPDMIRSIDYLGRTPLHYAIDYDAPLPVVCALLASDPAVAELCDHEGRTPLILACQIIANPAWGLTEEEEAERVRRINGTAAALSAAAPRNLLAEDRFGSTALEHAISNSAPQEMVLTLQVATARLCKMDAVLRNSQQREPSNGEQRQKTEHFGAKMDGISKQRSSCSLSGANPSA